MDWIARHGRSTAQMDEVSHRFVEEHSPPRILVKNGKPVNDAAAELMRQKNAHPPKPEPYPAVHRFTRRSL